VGDGGRWRWAWALVDEGTGMENEGARRESDDVNEKKYVDYEMPRMKRNKMKRS
jgi:hypothetical protein